MCMCPPVRLGLLYVHDFMKPTFSDYKSRTTPLKHKHGYVVVSRYYKQFCYVYQIK